MARQKEPKQQKVVKGQTQGSFINSNEKQEVAKVRHQNPPWAPLLELDGATILQNSSIREFQKGYTHYLAKALE